MQKYRHKGYRNEPLQTGPHPAKLAAQIREPPRPGYDRPTYLLLKRAFDVVASVFGLAILVPFVPFLTLLIKLDSKGPVLFKQVRLGRHGIPFTIYKFRTMMDHAPEIHNSDGSKYVAIDDPRLTRVGSVLRNYSIDELPQLLNILKGDMSVVGPRPETPGPPGLNGEIFRKKRLLRPGLTSLASIHGRNAIAWRERVAWDVKYVETASWRLDVSILMDLFSGAAARGSI